MWRDATRDGSRQTVRIQRPDGVILRGWLYPSRHPGAPWVLTFQGNNEVIGTIWSVEADNAIAAFIARHTPR